MPYARVVTCVCAPLLVAILFVTDPLRCNAAGDTLVIIPTVSGRLHQPRTDLTGLPGFPSCCSSLEHGAGLGGAVLVGLRLFRPIPELHIEGYLGLAHGSYSMYKDDFIGWSLVSTESGVGVDSAISRTTADLSITSVDLRMQALYMPQTLAGFGFAGGIAGNIDISSSASQKETLLRPSNVVFADTKTNERLTSSSSAASMLTPWINAYGGVVWQTQLSASIGLRLTAAYELALTPMISRESATLYAHALRFDVSVPFIVYTADDIKSPETPPSVSPSAAPSPKSTLRAALSVYELLPGDQLRDVGIVRIEETQSRQLYPLLPYIFFDQGSAVLNGNRYAFLSTAQTSNFNEERRFRFDNVTSERRSDVTLEVYYNILNIIGRRMRDLYPQSTLTIRGYNNGRDEERADTTLSRKRAEAIKEYLVRIWQIDASRLQTTAGNLSPKAALTTMSDARDKEDGFEENRRAELEPSDSRILDPVVVPDTIRTINIPALRYALSATSSEVLKEWSLTATHPFMPGDVPARSIINRRGQGVPPPSIDWMTGDSQRDIPKSEDPVKAQLTVCERGGSCDTVASRLPIEYVSIARKKRERRGNLAIDRYRLPLFAYGNDELLVAQKEIIERYVTPEIDDLTSIEVASFTDRKGSEELNLKLSERRAQQINTLLPPQGTKLVRGYGEGAPEMAAPFTNATPEGRLYNRTVEVILLKKYE